MATRIYVVTQTGAAPRLVMAANKQQAAQHVARKTIAAELCGQAQLVLLTKGGVEVESAAEGAES